MKNNELIKAMGAKLGAAIENGDTESFVAELQDSIDMSVEQMATAKVNAMVEQFQGETDERVLASRGLHALTSEEKEFYNKMIEARNSLTNFEVKLPLTTESRIMENVTVDHPLLQAIDFVDSKGLTQWILSKNLDYAAAWGDLNDAVATEANAAFSLVEFSQFKLSCWIPVPKTMLDLGQVWLDQFVVAYLSEIIARKIEDAIVNGTGQKMPVGMIKAINLDSQTVPAQDKETIAITDLSTMTIGEIAAKLTDDGKRKVGTIDMIVNPYDFWSIIYPALYYTNESGQITKSNAPINIYQSLAVAKGKAVCGILKNYFATAGFGVSTGKIEYSDHYKFLEDLRVFKARCVAYGTPKDNVSFYYYDISGVKEAAIPTRTQKARG